MTITPFSIANSIRYIDDINTEDVQIDNTNSVLTKSWIANSGLKVSESLTPDLYKRIENVCKKFNLDVKKVEAYVVSDPNINAWCYRTGKNSCLVVFHSEIINLLDFDEIEFIIGHELGHELALVMAAGFGLNARPDGRDRSSGAAPMHGDGSSPSSGPEMRRWSLPRLACRCRSG